VSSYGWPEHKPSFKARVGQWFGGQMAELKALATGGSSWWYSGQSLEQTGYSALIGDGAQTSIVAPVVRWIARNLPGAPIRVRQRIEAGETRVIESHAMLDLLESPNDFYDGDTLQKATAADLTVTGNAYWWAIPNSVGMPVQLWWMPSIFVEPRWPNSDNTVYVSHYDYKVDGVTYEIPPEEVIHFRDGIDPNNTRKGLAPLTALLREIYTDEEASRYTATILGNMGVPGTIITPTSDKPVSPEDAEKVKARYDQETGGRRRGGTIVFGQPTDIKSFGFSPEQLNLRGMRRLPEERVTAQLGVPAIVAGLGAGLDRSTFANYAEAREAGYEECIIPLQGLISSTLRRQLLTKWGDVRGLEVYYDTSDIRILQEDQNRLAERMRTLVTAGIIKRATALRELGLDYEESDEVYLMPINIVEVRPGEIIEEPPALPAPEPTPELVGT
jgi:HK97 family phage portal protein